MTATIYTSDDIGAPQITKGGFLIDFLKAILVYGYGTGDDEKLPLGWTLEFEDVDTKQAVFRMGGGTKTFIKVIDNPVTSYNSSQFFAYETMSDLNKGVTRCPSISDDALYSHITSAYSSGGTTLKKWTVIGDDSGFYFLPISGGFNPVDFTTDLNIALSCSHSLNYIGDYVPIGPADKNVFCMTLGKVNGVSSYFKPGFSFIYMMRGFDDEVGSLRVGTTTGIPDLFGNSAFGINTAMPDIGDQIMKARVTINETTVSKYFYGYFPGLYNPVGRFPDGALNASSLPPFYSVIDDEKTFYNFVTNNAGTVASAPNNTGQRFSIALGDNFRR